MTPEKILHLIESFSPQLEAIGSEPPPAPRWDQDWFPRLDAAAAYAIVRETRPKHIVEVGSGHSTRFMARAVKDGGLATRITSIDPLPRATIAGLDIEILKIRVQEAEARVFSALGPGDILFVDSSHQLKPGSDVEFLLQQVIPALPSGARVHFHDCFLPDDYPAAWAWRNYNEQAAVAMHAKIHHFETEFSSHAIVARSPERITGVLARLPLKPGAIESSLWLLKR